MENQINVLFTRPLAGLRGALPMLPSNRFQVIPCPTIEIRSVSQTPSLDRIFAGIADFDFIVFTSQIAVLETLQYLRHIGVDPAQFYRISVCAVGPVVSQQLNKFGLTTNVMPNKYTAQALADLFPVMRTHAPKVLLPRGNKSSKVLEDSLTRKGYAVESPVLYTTETCTSLDGNAEKLIRHGQVDCIAFTSPSSVSALRSILGPETFNHVLKDVTVAAIGPVTSKACADAGLTTKIQPADYTLQTMARAIANHFGYSISTLKGRSPTPGKGRALGGFTFGTPSRERLNSDQAVGKKVIRQHALATSHEEF